MFSLIFAWINGWVNNRAAGHLIRHRAHYDVIVMIFKVWHRTNYNRLTKKLPPILYARILSYLGHCTKTTYAPNQLISCHIQEVYIYVKYDKNLKESDVSFMHTTCPPAEIFLALDITGKIKKAFDGYCEYSRPVFKILINKLLAFSLVFSLSAWRADDLLSPVYPLWVVAYLSMHRHPFEWCAVH